MSEKEHGEGHDEVLYKEPCPKCGSKDNLVRYVDGHAHCYSAHCDHWEPPSDSPKSNHKTTRRKAMPAKFLKPDHPEAWVSAKGRRLTPSTLQRYGYFRADFKGKPVGVAVYNDQEGKPTLQKLRFPDKDFTAIKAEGAPGLRECQLFGQSTFGDKFDRRVVVTEGEIDAMTVAQVSDFKFAAVSVGTGADGVRKNLQANYRWLDRFDEIILWFDDDEAGKLAVEKCADLFAVGKVKIAKAAGFKDASDCLQANKPGDITAAIWSAVVWRPRGIVNAADCASDFTDEDNDPPSWHYPFERLQEMTRGLRPGEVVFHVAGTSVGKTTQLREIEAHLIFEEGLKIGHLGFEDMRRDVLMGIMSIKANRRLELDPLPRKEMVALHHEVFSNRKVELFDPEGAEWTMEAVLGYVRYMAKALDCQVLFVDPLSFIAAMIPQGMSVVQALDNASAALARSAKEFGVNIQITHHLKRTDGLAHEEGGRTSVNQLRGSGSLANFASVVVGWERNMQAEDPELRDLSLARILKNRKVGPTGPADILQFDPRTGRMSEVDLEWPDWEDHKKNKRGGSKSALGDNAFGKDY